MVADRGAPTCQGQVQNGWVAAWRVHSEPGGERETVRPPGFHNLGVRTPPGHDGAMQVLHKFSRTELLLGREGLDILRESTVAVFGLGGVGSYTVEALARTGVGHIVLVDFDEICLTNINRQLIALAPTVGKPKVDVMAARVREINKDCRVEPIKRFYAHDSREELLRADYSYVVDAIDSIQQKVDLAAECLGRGLRIVSCMGTGNKLDPTQFRVVDIAKTHTDPLAKAVRLGLRKRGIGKGLKCVFSPELPMALKESEGDCSTGCVCPNKGPQESGCAMRRQLPGSVAFVPSVAGLILAGVVIRDLLESVLAPEVLQDEPV